jgi:hypothetical protein
VPLRLDLLTRDQFFTTCAFVTRERNPQITDPYERYLMAFDLYMNSPANDPKHVNQVQQMFQNEMNISIGVLSLTAHDDVDALWEKYSDDHRGFCVGFDSAKLVEFCGSGGSVQYYDELPPIFPRPHHDLDVQMALEVFSKERKWEFEKEYRVTKFARPLAPANRIVHLPPVAFKCIILGADMTEEHEAEIKNAVATSIPGVPVERE